MDLGIRRIFLKPPGLAGDLIARLRDALSAAVEQQRELVTRTRSPHILELTSSLKETNVGFEVEHEPAEGWVVGRSLSPETAPLSPDELMSIAAGVFNALSVAHMPGRATFRPHGGIAPGTLVRGEDGVWKLTDFGFALAVLKVLGTQAFLNLAVGRPADRRTLSAASGVWEVIPSLDEPRDERIYSFVDPDRYAQVRQPDNILPPQFDASSDVVSAGLVLQFLAERNHPFAAYWGSNDEFRVAGSWEMLNVATPQSVTRVDLVGDSKSPLAEWWLRKHRMTVDRWVANRLSAEDIAASLKSLVRPLDMAEVERSRKRAGAERWLSRLEGFVQNQDWAAIDAARANPPDASAGPADFSTRFDKVQRHLLDFRRTQAEQQRRDAEVAARLGLLAQLERAASAGDWRTVASGLDQTDWSPLPAPETPRLESLRSAWAEIKARISADHKSIAAWLEQARHAISRSEWNTAAEILTAPPPVQHWPANAREQAQAFAVQCSQRIAAQKAACREWLDRLRVALDSDDHSTALRIFADRPDAREWPPDLAAECDVLQARLEEVGKAQAAELVAHRAWIDRAEAESAALRWTEALAQLDHPPPARQPLPEFVERAANLRRRCQREIAAQGDQQRAQVAEFLLAWLRKTVATGLANLIDPAGLSVEVQPFSGPAAKEDIPTAFAIHWAARPAGTDDVLGVFECRCRVERGRAQFADDPARLEEQVIRDLSSALRQLQDTKLKEWAAALDSTFLKQCNLTHSAALPVRKVPAVVSWSGGGADVTVEATLVWDARPAAWTVDSPNAWLSRVAERAIEGARGAVERAMLEQSPILAASRELLTISAARPPVVKWSALPAALRFDVVVGLKPRDRDRRDSPISLISVSLACPSPAAPQFNLDLRAAESAYARTVIEWQLRSIDRVSKALAKRVKKFPVKLILPAAFDRPLEIARWMLTAAGADPVALEARWDGTAAEFRHSDEWEAAISGAIDSAKRAAQLPAPPVPNQDKPAPSVEAEPRPVGDRGDQPAAAAASRSTIKRASRPEAPSEFGPRSEPESVAEAKTSTAAESLGAGEEPDRRPESTRARFRRGLVVAGLLAAVIVGALGGYAIWRGMSGGGGGGGSGGGGAKTEPPLYEKQLDELVKALEDPDTTSKLDRASLNKKLNELDALANEIKGVPDVGDYHDTLNRIKKAIVDCKELSYISAHDSNPTSSSSQSADSTGPVDLGDYATQLDAIKKIDLPSDYRALQTFRSHAIKSVCNRLSWGIGDGITRVNDAILKEIPHAGDASLTTIENKYTPWLEGANKVIKIPEDHPCYSDTQALRNLFDPINAAFKKRVFERREKIKQEREEQVQQQKRECDTKWNSYLTELKTAIDDARIKDAQDKLNKKPTCLVPPSRTTEWEELSGRIPPTFDKVKSQLFGGSRQSSENWEGYPSEVTASGNKKFKLVYWLNDDKKLTEVSTRLTKEKLKRELFSILDVSSKLHIFYLEVGSNLPTNRPTDVVVVGESLTPQEWMVAAITHEEIRKEKTWCWADQQWWACGSRNDAHSNIATVEFLPKLPSPADSAVEIAKWLENPLVGLPESGANSRNNDEEWNGFARYRSIKRVWPP